MFQSCSVREMKSTRNVQWQGGWELPPCVVWLLFFSFISRVYESRHRWCTQEYRVIVTEESGLWTGQNPFRTHEVGGCLEEHSSLCANWPERNCVSFISSWSTVFNTETEKVDFSRAPAGCYAARPLLSFHSYITDLDDVMKRLRGFSVPEEIELLKFKDLELLCQV